MPKRENAVAISAITGEGLPDLFEILDQYLTRSMKSVDVRLPITDGAALAWLYQHGEVVGRTDREDGMDVQVRLFSADLERFELLHPDRIIRPEA
ncbi:hypothetical protein [Gluconobacter oxydans]|uniref:hypothetical protein n=1 Tax=Gluconobacter oxydans TaxID=442 RepID=UPI0007834C0F|nr:hypothetical protein [Gluconobacter oxydans]KXV12992.1 hypothetical protein AD932_05285 [Gluconobacter oxydans]